MAISWYPTDNSQDGQLYLVSTVCHSLVGSPSFILETKGQNKQQSLYCSAQVAAKSGKTYSVFLSSELLDSPGLSTFLLVALADGVATLALFIPFTFLPALSSSSRAWLSQEEPC